MGSIGGMLGTSGGAGGTGFAGPQGAPIDTPTTVDQANTAYTGSQAALTQQNQFANALLGQNGIQNQNQVYNQLQGVANGTGPNPAQAMLAQSTGQNTANTAALMAGNRGSNANAGLIARQAAQQGAQNQQAAAGQAATMQANQSLGAIGQMGTMAGQQVANTQNAIGANNQFNQGEQGQILGGIAAQNNAKVGMQSNINDANAGLAKTTMAGQQSLQGGIMNGLGSMLAEGGQVRKMYYAGTPDQPVSVDYNNQDPVNYGTGATDMSQVGPQAAPAPQVGMVPNAAAIHAQMQTQPQQSTQGTPSSSFGKFMQGLGNSYSSKDKNSSQPQNSITQGASSLAQGIGRMFSSSAPKTSDTTLNKSQMNDLDLGVNPGAAPAQQQTTSDNDMQSGGNMAAKGGKVPALVSPGEKYLSPKAVKAVAKGADPMKAGETIPGTPKVGGAKNSYANDTVPKTLEEGGVVIPRSVTKSKQPSEAARRFVHAIAAKHGMRIK